MRALRAAAITAAFFTGATPATADTFVGPSGQAVQQTKCSHSPSSCYNEAHNACRGPYQIVDSESHAGGMLADIFPGPVTWYSFTYVCGRSDGRLASFPLRGAAPRMPNNPFQSRTTNCFSNHFGNMTSTSCY
jgi:hypothetical protein